jgi:ribonuclease P protein component
MSHRFTPGVRLRSHVDFQAVHEQGRRVRARFVTLIGRPNAMDRDRLGIIASRKLGGAVTRNRAKRRLREVFRRQDPDLSAARGHRPLDVVVIARREFIDAPLAVVEADFQVALRKLRGTK